MVPDRAEREAVKHKEGTDYDPLRWKDFGLNLMKMSSGEIGRTLGGLKVEIARQTLSV